VAEETLPVTTSLMIILLGLNCLLAFTMLIALFSVFRHGKRLIRLSREADDVAKQVDAYRAACDATREEADEESDDSSRGEELPS